MDREMFEHMLALEFPARFYPADKARLYAAVDALAPDEMRAYGEFRLDALRAQA